MRPPCASGLDHVIRVLFAIGAYPPSTGGAQLHTAALADALASHTSVSPAVLTMWRSTRNDWLRASTADLRVGSRVSDEQIPVTTVGLKSDWSRKDAVAAATYLPARRRSARHFASRLDMGPIEVDMIHIVRLGREHLALAALEAAQRKGIPVALTPNHHPRWSSWRPDPVWRAIYRNSDLLFALTHVEKGMLMRLGVAAERIMITGIGPLLSSAPVNLTDVQAAVGVQPYVLFLGQQLGYKRADVALRALKLLVRDFPEVQLVLAGPASDETLALARRLGLDSRVRQLGVVSPELKTGLLQHASCLLHPSTQESFGGVLIEAASLGLPFICADTPQLREVTETLAWGRAAKVTPHAFAVAAADILGHKPKEAARGAAAERSRALFSWESLAVRYASGYARLVSERGKRVSDGN